MKFFKIFPLVYLFFIGCSSAPDININELNKSQLLKVESSNNNQYIYIDIPKNFNLDEEIINKELNKFSNKINSSNFFKNENSGFVKKIDSIFLNQNNHLYSIHKISLSDSINQIIYKLDSNKVSFFKNIFYEKNKLNKIKVIKKNYFDDFSYIPDKVLLLPCPNIDIPSSFNLLPNAPRKYRSGIHQGIDFPGLYSSKILSVLDGIIIRADHNYKEVSNDFRNNLLEKASIIQRTPSDIFVNILYGRTIMIDHGFNITTNKRIISIYAHLSEINSNIKVGNKVSRGGFIGNVGNSGTSDGAKGNKKAAHLHFELIIQDKDGERYLGKEIYKNELINLLERVFSSR